MYTPSYIVDHQSIHSSPELTKISAVLCLRRKAAGIASRATEKLLIVYHISGFEDLPRSEAQTLKRGCRDYRGV